MYADRTFADIIRAGVAVVGARDAGTVAWLKDTTFFWITAVKGAGVAVITHFRQRDRAGFVFARIIERTLITIITLCGVCVMGTIAVVANIVCADIAFIKARNAILCLRMRALSIQAHVLCAIISVFKTFSFRCRLVTAARKRVAPIR